MHAYAGRQFVPFLWWSLDQFEGLKASDSDSLVNTLNEIFIQLFIMYKNQELPKLFTLKKTISITNLQIHQNM